MKRLLDKRLLVVLAVCAGIGSQVAALILMVWLTYVLGLWFAWAIIALWFLGGQLSDWAVQKMKGL